MKGSSLSRQKLELYLKDLLVPQIFEDYGPNGLQIEGVEEITRVGFAVSATQESVQQAVERGCQALIVHHGLFWKFHGVRTITGPFAKRVIPLIQKGINLFAYHLPLDAHLEVGNAAQLGAKLGLQGCTSLANHKGPLGVQGTLPSPLLPRQLKDLLQNLLQHSVLLSTYDEARPINTLGIITGGANSEWILAKAAGLDAYLTGEMSEHDWHEAKEGGVHMFAGGHHATEQFGIQALMKRIEHEFSLECLFFNSPNPA